MWVASVLLGLVIASSLLSPAAAEPMRTWTAGDKSNIYKSGPLTLAFGEGRDSDGAAVPGVQIQMKGFAPYSIIGQAGTNPVKATYAIAKLDPRNAIPQIIFSSTSGGENCCNRVFIAEKISSGWTAFDLGLWSGPPLSDVPKDVDGDKIADLVFSDSRFFYAFNAGDQGILPPIIINVVNNAVQDVSKQPRYNKLYAARMAKAKEACAAHDNGACAAYAGSAARIGKLDEAWKFVLANVDKQAHFDNEGRCRSRTGCKGALPKPKDFAQSLHWFLEDNGYLAVKGRP